jgi:hypothetical protein
VPKDGKFQSALVSRLVNTVMICGKKSTAQRIVYKAFESISAKNPASNPVEILQRAVDNAKPRIETKARRPIRPTANTPWNAPATSALPRTLTPARRPPPSAFCFTPASSTRSATWMTATP